MPPLRQIVSCGLLAVAVCAAPASAARWDFDGNDSDALGAHGDVGRDYPGPRPPEFPDFADDNTAVRLDRGAYLSLQDPGPDSRFDFTNGDRLTLEAWVNVDQLSDGALRYVIGKGRTGSPEFARDNQNWALRVVGDSGTAKLSFLFATELSSNDSHWHRWTSRSGFPVSSGWHHVAVAYRFGEPDSIRGWVNGEPTEGAWDMGGATAEPPVVDDDEIRIGAGGFQGAIDAVAVHRELLGDQEIASRFRRVGEPRVVRPMPETMPRLDVPDGRVLVTFGERMPTHERWLNEGEPWPEEISQWLGDAFLLPRIPLRYDDWGIRTAWNGPLLVRMAADVELPAGRHRFLLRARGLSRLWVDGEVVARTEAVTERPPDGEEPITPVAEPPLPGLRPRGYRQQEVLGEATIADAGAGDTRRVVLEMIVGGDGQRTESGEVGVAVETDGGRSFAVLRPASQAGAELVDPCKHAGAGGEGCGLTELPLTDAAVQPALARIEASLSAHDDSKRRRAASSQDAFWHRRHEAARQWAQQHPAPPIPSLAVADFSHPVDRFLAAKIERARRPAVGSDAGRAEQFHAEVLPILRQHCFRCHGEKDKGGLKLDTRAAALAGGMSELPAVVPGEPDESELLYRVRAGDMPPTGDGLSEQQIAVLQQWIEDGAAWPDPPLDEAAVSIPPVVDDEAFLRRIYLDTVGVPPTQREAEAFLADEDADKRAELIDRLLRDERVADHWMSFWLDLLAENPTLLNDSLNSTGPFRWFLYDSLRDQKALDRMVTELLMMRGGTDHGGSAGFAVAAENDSPMAAKSHIVSSAFLGIEMECARCHDSPYHRTTQRDLYSVAAMLNQGPLTVPETSRVPAEFFEQKQRESLIEVTLEPDASIAADWPFAEITGARNDASLDQLMHQPDDTRQRLAALITAPQNARFPRVMVNHVWNRMMGAGLVDPVHDWEGRSASHPELLDWLAHELTTHDYDLRHIMRLIATSRAYQREATGNNKDAEPVRRFFAAPDRRRLTAEQVVDSLHAAVGRPMDVEELTFVHDGRRPMSSRLSLGRPSRAWMMATLNNERDRPSLSLPRAQAVADVLKAFGWTGSRQKPIHHRDVQPNVLQPGVLANSTLSVTLTRAASESELAELALQAESAEALVEALFLRILTRRPTAGERAAFVRALSPQFADRRLPAEEVEPPPKLPPLPRVTWFNHLRPRANTIQQEVERRVRQGPPADPRLRDPWRKVYEDVVWSLINHREFVWMP